MYYIYIQNTFLIRWMCSGRKMGPTDNDDGDDDDDIVPKMRRVSTVSERDGMIL